MNVQLVDWNMSQISTLTCATDPTQTFEYEEFNQ